ncbi:MAG: MSMEG_6728 family protein [Actinomycetes bacterium]
MQTFLPYADFGRCGAVLDPQRLGKQRVETLQILRALHLPEYGWANHPAVGMWRGRTEALVLYGLACVREWTSRGHLDSTHCSITEFAPGVAGRTQDDLADQDLLPSWLGHERLHLSHRSALLRKLPDWYRPLFGGELPDDLPYVWPPPDPVPPGRVERGTKVWVVRAPSLELLGRFLQEGFVGLGTQSGLAVDVGGMDGAAMRNALRAVSPARRAGKDLRQLEAFVQQVEAGDLVSVPIEDGTALLVGLVTGEYEFEGSAAAPHRRAVRWEGRRERSDVRPSAAMQDPRALFRVTLAE